MLDTITVLAGLSALLLLVLQPTPCHCQDPCSDTVYETMAMYEGRRQSTYETQADDQLICDDQIDSDAWVRFKNGNLSYNITNTDCIDSNYCGTLAPMWISEFSAHPTVVGTEASATVCVNFGTTSCCNGFGSMRIKLCEDADMKKFFVYKLPAPPACHAAYCADPVEEEPCPPNFYRDLFTNECEPSHPSQTPPTLEGPTNEGTFSCHVHYTGEPAKVASARFDVQFLFDGKAGFFHPPTTVRAGESATLEANLVMGTKVSCSSTPYWEQRAGEPKESVLESRTDYFIGVQVETNRIEISEGDDRAREVKLWSTMPIVCSTDPCSVCTRLILKETTLTDCEYCFPSTGWDPAVKRAYGDPLKVRADRNPRVDETTVNVLDFGPFTYKHDNPDSREVWLGYQMNDIAVVVGDTEYGMCQSHNDPHLLSFDGKRFDMFEVGQFLLFKSTAARVFEVHVRYWLCNPKSQISCNCGVAVREGNAVLGVDKCGSRTLGSDSRPKVMKYSPGSLPPGAYVTTDGAQGFTINMPSGAYVKLSRSIGMIKVFALPEDRGRASGLCGNFDGNPNNDDTTATHRLPEKQSFFDFDPWPQMNVPEPTVTRCHCGADVIDCSAPEDTGTEDRVDPLEPTGKGGPVDGRRRRKRDVDRRSDNVDDEVVVEFDYGLDFVVDKHFTWPTKSGISEKGARDICESAFDALPYKDDCLNLTSFDLEPTILLCIEDIKMMDSSDFVGASIDTFEESCHFLLIQKKTPPMEILGKMCPSQCSSQGTCVDGVCKCDAGYQGPDCSLVEGSPPVLHYIPGTGRCDLTLRPCMEFRLVGSSFMKTSELACRVTEIASKAAAGDTPVIHSQTVLSTTQGTAKFITSSEIACRLPEIASQDMAYYQLRFAFSYDGVTYSNEIDLTVFDGECMSCESDCENPNSWTMLSDTCIIDGRCALDGDLYNDCLVCDPSKSRDSWTRDGERCNDEIVQGSSSTTQESPATTPSSKDNNNMLIIILACLGGAVVIIIACVVVVVIYRRIANAKKAEAEDHPYDVPMEGPHGAENPYQEIEDIQVPGPTYDNNENARAEAAAQNADNT